MKPFDTDKMPWLFTPHGDGELNEYFSTDHSKSISAPTTARSSQRLQRKCLQAFPRAVTGSQESSATNFTTISADINTRSCGLRI